MNFPSVRRPSRGLFGLAILCASLALLGLSAAPALAIRTHQFLTSFTPTGGFANPVGVAINQNTHHVYVADISAGVVDNFLATGAPDPTMPQLSGPALGNPYGVAVDNSAEPTQGDIYVATRASGFVQQYDPSGVATSTQITVAEIPADGTAQSGGLPNVVNNGSLAPSGVAVGSNADVYVADQANSVVDKFSPAGVFIAQIGSGSLPSPTLLDLDSSGNLYVANNGAGLLEFSPAGECLHSCAAVDPAASQGVAFDPAGNILAAETPQISEYDPSQNQIAHFGSFGAAGGIAIDQESEEVYVTDVYSATVSVFGPAVLLPNLTTGIASNVLRTSATVSGHVDLEGGSNVTECHFDYGTDTNYASGSAPCLDAGNAEVGTTANPITASTDVHADLSAVAAATTYHYRLAAANAKGSTTGEDLSFTTANAVIDLTTGAATNVTANNADLTGSFTGDGTHTNYYFQYGASTSYGHTSAASDAGSASGPQTVGISISGLQEGTIYHYRIVASNSLGTTVAEDQTLRTLQPPTIEGLFSSELSANTADLHVTINPQGLDTHYQFEYGTTSAYGESAPGAPEDIGSSQLAQAREVHLANLQEGVTYHFRVVASNALGTTTSEDQTFNFFPPTCPNSHIRQQTGGQYLPDCRAYEIVSPDNAGGTTLYPEGPNSPVATSPSRFAFGGILGKIPGAGPAENDVGDLYVSTRTSIGWATRYVGIPGTEAVEDSGPPLQNDGVPVRDSPRGVLSDLSMSTFMDWNDGDSDFASRRSRGSFAPYLWDAGGNFIERLPTNLDSVPGTAELFGLGNSNLFYGATQPSPDFTHYFFSSAPWYGGRPAAVFAPGGKTAAPGSAYDNNLTNKTVTLVSVKANNEDIPPNSGDEAEAIAFPGVSTDGSHILMSTSSTPTCNEGISEICPDPNTEPVQRRLYMRVADAVTYEIAPGHEVEYVGMTADGSKVYFASEEQLTPDDHDASTDLYMWSEATDSLILISKGDNSGAIGEPGNTDSCSASWTTNCGVVAFSTGAAPSQTASNSDPTNADFAPQNGLGGNGVSDSALATNSGDIYFYSPEQLDGDRGISDQQNLYDYRDGQLQYVTTFTPGRYCVPPGQASGNSYCSGGPMLRAQVSSDDSHMAFLTSSRVTSYDNAGHVEMYTYDPSTGKLLCVSCLPSGTAPTTDVEASLDGLFMSDDGRTFFSTGDALVPQDTDGVRDVYEYSDGRPQLISSGTSANDNGSAIGAFGAETLARAGLVGVSADGTDVYFSTYDSLVGQDRNGNTLKFYDARTGGGFPFNPPAAPCAAADDCHGVGSSVPPATAGGTGAELGAGGNLTPERPKQRHHKRRKHKRASHPRHRGSR